MSILLPTHCTRMVIALCLRRGPRQRLCDRPDEASQLARDRLGTESLAASHPDTPWPQIAATRNFLAHQYLGVDLVLVWNIVERDLPSLEKQILD